MPQKISLLAYFSCHKLMRKLAENALKNCSDSKNIEILFFIKSDNEKCKAEASKLYINFSPDLFNDPKPKIRVLCNSDDEDWENKLLEKVSHEMVMFFSDKQSRADLHDISDLEKIKWDLEIGHKV